MQWIRRKIGSYHWYCTCAWGWGWCLLRWLLCVVETVLTCLYWLAWTWDAWFKAWALSRSHSLWQLLPLPLVKESFPSPRCLSPARVLHSHWIPSWSGHQGSQECYKTRKEWRSLVASFMIIRIVPHALLQLAQVLATVAFREGKLEAEVLEFIIIIYHADHY